MDVFDVSKATNIVGKSDGTTSSIAPGGVLLANTTAAQYCSWLDYNVNSQLNRFGVHNGGAQSDELLDEMWVSIAVVPVNPAVAGIDIVFCRSRVMISLRRMGISKSGQFRYADNSGYNLDNQVLLFRVQLPAGSFLLLGDVEEIVEW